MSNLRMTLPPLSPGEQSAHQLLVAIPALNEASTIGDVIRRIPRYYSGVTRMEILVVDDGSTDNTSLLAEREGATVIRHSRRLGVGAAFHTALTYGIEHGADIIVSLDADGQFNPEDIPQLISPLLDGSADFATASRFKDPALVPKMPAIKLWGNRVMSRLISRLAGQKLYDVSCGMRAYSKNAALQLHLLGRFTYTQEVLLNLAFKHFRIAEVPLSVHGEREVGNSRVANSLWRYALRSSQIIFRCYRDYHPLRFFGSMAVLALLAATGLGVFFLQHYLRTGRFHPNTWAGVTSGALVGLAILLLHMGVIGDMLNRHRIYLEEILYRLRRTAGSQNGSI